MMDLSLLFRLRLRTPRLELRLPDERELVALGELARAGIHPPEDMPFAVAWTDRSAEPSFVADVVAHHLAARSAWHPDAWSLLLGVWADGVLVGNIELAATRFAETRTVSTGSWLGAEFQGRGIGTEMRAAVLDLAFAGLGAGTAESGALEGNLRSARVSERLGYEPNGEAVLAPRGEPVREQRYRLTRERWFAFRPFTAEVEGLEPCVALFGVSARRRSA